MDREVVIGIANGKVFRRALVHTVAAAFLAGLDFEQVQEVASEAMILAAHSASRVGLSPDHVPAFAALTDGSLADGMFSERVIEHCRRDWDELVEALVTDDVVHDIAAQAAVEEEMDDWLTDVLGGGS